MRSCTAQNHFTRFQNTIHRFLSNGRIFGYDHKWFLDQYYEIKQEPAYRKLPRHLTAELFQTFNEGMKRLYQPELCGDDLYRLANGKKNPDDVPYLRYFHEMPDGSLVESWNPGIVKDSGKHRWNHRRDKTF